MPKLFTDEIIDDLDVLFSFRGDEAFYLQRSLRMRPGEILTLGTGDGMDLEGEIVRMTADEVQVKWLSKVRNPAEPPYRAVLYQGLLKGEKMEWVIQKAVELGVSAVVPVACKRSVAKLEGKDISKKLDRWNKIALEAARQSGRGVIPCVMPPVSFAEAAEKAEGFAFIPWESEQECSMSTVLANWDGEKAAEISFFIGPEGGFDEEEIQLAKRRGIQSVSLGRRILRAETAGLAVLAILSYRLEGI